MSDRQRKFLSHWEEHFEPVICSGRYPGKEMLYREQLEVITETFLVESSSGIIKPMDWRQLCERLKTDDTLKTLTEEVSSKLQFIFDERNTLPPRRAMQCRMAILGIYLVRLSQEVEDDLWNRLESQLWTVVRGWFSWQQAEKRDPQWFVFEFGDAKQT